MDDGVEVGVSAARRRRDAQHLLELEQLHRERWIWCGNGADALSVANREGVGEP